MPDTYDELVAMNARLRDDLDAARTNLRDLVQWWEVEIDDNCTEEEWHHGWWNRLDRCRAILAAQPAVGTTVALSVEPIAECSQPPMGCANCRDFTSRTDGKDGCRFLPSNEQPAAASAEPKCEMCGGAGKLPIMGFDENNMPKADGEADCPFCNTNKEKPHE